MTKWHGGKGSARRPAQVPEETLRDNWDRIFGGSEEPDDFDEILDNVRRNLNETLFTGYDFDNEGEESVEVRFVGVECGGPTVIIDLQHMTVGYDIDTLTGELTRCCICSAWSSSECICGAWDQ